MNPQLQENVRQRMTHMIELYHRFVQNEVAEEEIDGRCKEIFVPLLENIKHLVPTRTELLFDHKFYRLDDMLREMLKKGPDGKPKEVSIMVGAYAVYGFSGWLELREGLEELRNAWEHIFAMRIMPLEQDKMVSKGITIFLSLKLE